MALPPKFAAQKLRFRAPASNESAAGVNSSTHSLEVFLDYTCPFSAKQFNTLYNTVVPMIRENQDWSAGLEVIFRQQVQPWHPSSTLTHEAALAVLKLAPANFWVSVAFRVGSKSTQDYRLIPVIGLQRRALQAAGELL